ncbi:hypothetical protein Ddye_032391 [Dipteronia dyeriana]|uniref:Uncharacterized protein n=1 Tax=Dipteronia dyeriana TaxID=168575 RepID=A0AAD9TK46_9ROSI|nr:hypothetical protein Ddye_032391 [Dipteronia dyeriana]
MHSDSEVVTKKQSQLARVMHSDSEVATIEQSQLARATFSDSEVARFEIQMLVRGDQRSHNKQSKSKTLSIQAESLPEQCRMQPAVKLEMSSSSPTSPQNQPTVGVRRSKKCASHGKRSKAPREGTRDAGSPSKPSQPTCVELRMRDSNSVSQGRLPKPKTFHKNEPTCG